uniref:Choline/carnitine acyltransferase domain-containing protein n=1 Tax=Peronospora matthiolae TaxID=2874970 RepID=A0AAV1TL97_9STRA
MLHPRPRLPCAFSRLSGYVQDTIVPTFHFQKSLPRLPIPKLEDSLARYLAALEPVVTRPQLAETERAVRAFMRGVGPDLQRALIARDVSHPHTSYINQWWLDMYLTDRQPLPGNFNPQVKLKMDPVEAKNSQSQRATSLIASSVRVYRTLRDGHLKPDVFHTNSIVTTTTPAFDYYCKLLPERVSFYGAAALGAYPLDMSQYKHLFASTRVPRKGRDVLQIAATASKHVVVQRGTKFYSFDVLTDSGDAVSDEEILGNIEAILAEPMATKSDETPGVGLLTTLNRDVWADARLKLETTDGANKKSLEVIDSALFMVCLEYKAPKTAEEVSRTFLLGDGSNRWFDKSFQLIVAANGTASVNFEHAWGDGIAVLRYINELYNDSVKSPVVKASRQGQFRELSWNIRGEMMTVLKQAKMRYEKWMLKLLVACAETPVTRAVGKQYNIGTDGLMQMTIQLAHFKLHQKFVATYESASTAAFKHGRTETVRSCTNEAVNFVHKMVDASCSDTERANALRAAVAKHSELTKNAVMGQGFDRHLFALRAMAELQGMDVPELYKLPAHQTLNKIILSTSTLSSPALEGGSFGPVNDECYGIGYGIEKEGSAFQLSGFRDDVSQLKELLVESIVDLERLLADTTPKK